MPTKTAPKATPEIPMMNGATMIRESVVIRPLQEAIVQFRLLGVTQSLPLWWHAVSQWGWSLQAERLVAPLTVWIALLGGCWLLLRAEGVRPRRVPAQSIQAPLRSLVTKARP